MIRRLGATPLGVWAIKHIVAPLHKRLYRLTAGIGLPMGGSKGNILLLTTKGRRSGKDRTTPVFHLQDGERLIICNVNPGFESTNPWVLNLRAHPMAKVQIGRQIAEYRAREVNEAELEIYWPRLVEVWPAYQSHYEKSGKRAVFVLEPI